MPANTTQSPSAINPENPTDKWALHRETVEAADAAPPTDVKAHGMNMLGYEEAVIEVIPLGATANAALSVYWWSEAASAWIQDQTLLTFAAVGANIPWTAIIPARGRRMFVAVTAGVSASNGVDIRVAGHRSIVSGM